MNSKFVLASSAIFLGVLGLSLNFFPAEILSLFYQDAILPFQLLLRLMGALYIAFAMVTG